MKNTTSNEDWPLCIVIYDAYRCGVAKSASAIRYQPGDELGNAAIFTEKQFHQTTTAPSTCVTSIDKSLMLLSSVSPSVICN